MGLYMPFETQFEPIVRIGENVAIPQGNGGYKYYKVVYIEPVQPIIVPISLSPYQKGKEATLNEIKLEDNEAGQWRMQVLDFALIRMKYPRAAQKWTTKETETYATPFSNGVPNTLEFYTYKDDVPTLVVDNPFGEDHLVRVMITGFKYSLRELERPPAEYTVLPVYSTIYVVGSGRR